MLHRTHNIKCYLSHNKVRLMNGHCSLKYKAAPICLCHQTTQWKTISTYVCMHKYVPIIIHIKTRFCIISKHTFKRINVLCVLESRACVLVNMRTITTAGVRGSLLCTQSAQADKSLTPSHRSSLQIGHDINRLKREDGSHRDCPITENVKVLQQQEELGSSSGSWVSQSLM